jgi:beta-lactamase regulating signal transducer with metallopeptidase domain
MAYALLVGALVALAAYALDGVCRLVGRPTRWVWAGVMALTVALVALAPQRNSRGEVVVLPAAIEVTSTSVETPSTTVAGSVVASLRRLRGAIESGVARAFAKVGRLASPPMERGLVLLWMVLSAAAFLVFLAVHGRLRRARRTWPATELHGARVRLAPNAGPAVIGLARPEIVVPRWLLQRSDAEQRMVIAHEAEHLRARDPLLLTVACAAVAIVAWHPAMWWMLSRLRLAMELDCDERVVRSGIAPRSYGALLIELAGRCSGGMRLGAPALADGPSHLERRLVAMTTHRPKFARASACALAVCSIALFALACDAELPTSEEVNSMDVSAAEGAAQRLTLIGVNDSLVVFTIDGEEVTAQAAHALSPDDIASIEVLKNRKQLVGGDDPGTESGEVHIVTRKGAEALGLPGRRVFRGDTLTRIVAMVRRDSAGKALPAGDEATWKMSADTVVLTNVTQGTKRELRMKPLMKGAANRKPFDGVLLLNGVRVKNSELANIPPGDIVSVEVVKGDAARDLYADSAAANGVIRITTRSGAKTP